MQIPHIRAAVITVNTEEDVINPFDLKCSLREAVITANANPPGVIIAPPGECAPGSGDDEIVFDPSLDQVPILLTIAGAGDNTALTGDIDISDNLTVTGRGQVIP
jgi:CSLREA domain-containing protein